jgi:hypothetical protein
VQVSIPLQIESPQAGPPVEELALEAAALEDDAVLEDEAALVEEAAVLDAEAAELALVAVEDELDAVTDPAPLPDVDVPSTAPPPLELVVDALTLDPPPP